MAESVDALDSKSSPVQPRVRVRLPASAQRALRIQPVGDFEEENIVRRRCEYLGKIPAKLVFARMADIGSLLRPDEIER